MSKKDDNDDPAKSSTDALSSIGVALVNKISDQLALALILVDVVCAVVAIVGLAVGILYPLGLFAVCVLLTIPILVRRDAKQKLTKEIDRPSRVPTPEELSESYGMTDYLLASGLCNT
jgi:hypothetical protein